MENALSHISIGLSLTSIGILLKLSFRFGRFMEQFSDLKQKVRIHDQLLGIPVGAQIHTRMETE